VFSHWKGDCEDSEEAECTLTMDADKETWGAFPKESVETEDFYA